MSAGLMSLERFSAGLMSLKLTTPKLGDLPNLPSSSPRCGHGTEKNQYGHRDEDVVHHVARIVRH